MTHPFEPFRTPGRLPVLLVFAWLTPLAFSAEGAPKPATPGRPDYCGVWGIWGGEKVSREGRPWFKGVVVTTNWVSVEPQDGQYDWSSLDEKARQVAGNGLYMMVLVYHGDKCPAWIYESGGVPKVITDATNKKNSVHPYYIDPHYKPLLSRLIRATAQHIAAYPPEIRSRIIGVQCPTGKSGDPQPYNGEPLDKKYDLPSHGKEWIDWTLGMFPVYRDAYKDMQPPLFLLFKGPNPDSNDWLMKNIPDSWRKPHAVAQGYSFNNEMEYVNELYPLTREERNGVLIRTRGELDNTELRGKNWFNAAPVWNVYWSGLWVLTYGLDIWNQLPGVLEDDRFAPTFEFVSRYAGYKSPADSPGAWVALRDGLDAMDKERFPEDRFGPVNARGDSKLCTNEERYKKIAEANAPYGAALDDLAHLTTAGLNVRRELKGLNDVGSNLWPGNYGMFLTQDDPNGTSRGHWRVGPLDQPFGRYARGFRHAEGKDAMRFRIDDGFFGEGPLGGKSAVKVRVVYFDQGHGRWALVYDAVDNPQKTAGEVEKTDSGRWREKIVSIADGNFGHRCPHGADLVLVNTDEEDDIFHMVEVMRGGE
ncbi:MAG: hypothetical protein NTW86_03445 [Candidatus Sumerlaeota bacterium]|nr:hypothetical protein [Candidatus Sumerlaeota bacterium]